MTLIRRGKVRRLFLLDPNLKSLYGHYITYADSVATAAQAIGVECHLLGHYDISSELAAAFGVTRAFRCDIWHTSADTAYYSDENQKLINDFFRHDAIAALEQHDLSADDMIFYPTNAAGQIDGIASVVSHFSELKVQHSILLRYPSEYYQGAIAARGFARLETLSKENRVRFVTDSHRLSYDLGSLTSLRIDVLPIPHTLEPLSNETMPPEERPLCLVSLGNARAEKGLAEIFQAIRLSAGLPWGARLRFRIQVNDPDREAADVIAAYLQREDARVELINAALDLDAYADLLRSADAVMVPYHRDVYAARTSGVFLEAVAAGKVVITTKDTWMSDLVTSYGSGLLVSNRSGSDLAARLKDFAEQHSVLSKQALDAVKQIRAFHNPNNFIESLLGEVSVTAARQRRAAIFYPWGDIAGRSGAAMRTNLLARYLKGKGYDVRILYLGENDIAISPGIIAEHYKAEHWHTEPMSLAINKHIKQATGRDAPVGLHLYYHLQSYADGAFKKRCQRLVRWADEIFVEYSYFAEVVSEMASSIGKSTTVSVYDLVSQIVRDIEPVFSATRALEMAGLRKSSKVVFSSQQEADICAAENLEHIVVPHPINVSIKTGIDRTLAEFIVKNILKIEVKSRSICLFVGTSYHPNVIAAERIRALALNAEFDERLRDVLFIIAGSAHDVKESKNFVALGYVEDLALEALYSVAEIILIPLELGSGASVKSIEALGRGCCIIATSIGMRGFPVVEGKHCIIENDIACFGDRIRELLKNKPLAAELRRQAKEFGRQYDYRSLYEAYEVGDGNNADLAFQDLVESSDPPLDLTQFFPRLVDGRLSPQGAQWLLQNANIEDLDCTQIVGLANMTAGSGTASPLDFDFHKILLNKQPTNIQQLIAKWEFLYATNSEGLQEAFFDELQVTLLAPQPDGIAAFCDSLATIVPSFMLWMMDVLKSKSHQELNAATVFAMSQLYERNDGPRQDIINLLSTALAKGMDPYSVLISRGRLRLAEGDNGGAQDLLDFIASGIETAHIAREQLRQSCLDTAWRHVEQKRYVEAIELADILISHGEPIAAAHYICGLSHHSLGDNLAEAERQYDLALSEGIEPTWTLYHRGRLRLSLGDARGREDLKKLILSGGEAEYAAREALKNVPQHSRFAKVQTFWEKTVRRTR